MITHPLNCPKCHRLGRIKLRMGRKIFVQHVCPGPWTLARIEHADPMTTPFRVILWGVTADELRAAGYTVPS